MVADKPRVVIIGAGMAGLTAANRLYTVAGGKDVFEICIVEGGQRIGGRINTTEFGGDRIEMGATWIHGISGSPVYGIAQKIGSLESKMPWECKDELNEAKLSAAVTRAEGGYVVNPGVVEPISSHFHQLMSLAQCKGEKVDVGDLRVRSVGSYLKLGLQQWSHWRSQSAEDGEVTVFGNWTRSMLEEAVFRVFENIQRTYTGAGDLFNLDYAAESEYQMFPGDEITIPRGYVTIPEALASVLPPGMIQLGKKVDKIEWLGSENYDDHGGKSSNRPVKLHFSDGSVMDADHVICTVSLGVLKAGVNDESGGGLFSPPLPLMKKEAISRLGYGVVNKLFLQLGSPEGQEEGNICKIPFMKMVFHQADSEFRHKKIPLWMRKTASIYPIYNNSSVMLSWFAGKEALELESLDDEAIIDGVSTTISSFISNSSPFLEVCNGDMGSQAPAFEFCKVMKSKWGTDPLFLGSYSYVAVGSSGDDFDTLAQPLPRAEENGSKTGSPPLQILFAGEATHRTHYSTTHGAYFSGLREAGRLLQHYNLVKHITDTE